MIFYQVGNYRSDNSSDGQLLMLMNNGCPFNAADNLKYCNYMLAIKDDVEANEVIKTKVDAVWKENKCIAEEACSYCYMDQMDPRAPKDPKAKLCINPRPSSCPETSEAQNPDSLLNESLQDSGFNNRKKRQLTKNYVMERAAHKVDFDSEARFIKMLMDLSNKHRQKILSFYQFLNPIYL